MNEDLECKRLKIGNAPLLVKSTNARQQYLGLYSNITFRKAIIEKIARGSSKTFVSRCIRPNRFPRDVG